MNKKLFTSLLVATTLTIGTLLIAEENTINPALEENTLDIINETDITELKSELKDAMNDEELNVANTTIEKLQKKMITKKKVKSHESRASFLSSLRKKLRIASLYCQGTWLVCKKEHYKDENKKLSFPEKAKLSWNVTKEISSQVTNIYFPEKLKAEPLTYTLDHLKNHLKNHNKKYIELAILTILTNVSFHQKKLPLKTTLLIWAIMFALDDYLLDYLL